MNLFSFVKSADAGVLQDIGRWNDATANYLRDFFAGDIERVRGTRFGDNIAKIAYMAETAVMEPNTFRGVRDVQNRLQAGAIVTEDIDFLFVDALATAPWNIVGSQPETTKGAGTSLMEELVKESKELGYMGRLKLIAIERALSFYTGIGFTEDEDDSRSLELTPIAAERFLERLQSHRRNASQ